MRWRGIEVIIKLLHVLPVIALGVGESEQPFLENGISPVPQRQREAEATMVVADSSNSVLAPAISAAARVIVWKIFPGSAVRRIIFAHRAPLSFGQIRSPAPPGLFAVVSGAKALLFRSGRGVAA